MKKLGLIGGTGPESTIEYYRQIVYGVQKRTGNFPNLTVESLSVFDVLNFCDRADYKGLVQYLLHGVQRLSNAGADFACLTGITPHIVYNEFAAQSPIPIVSMIESACEYARTKCYTKLALLGTYPTMSGNFIQKAFSAYNIEILTPPENEMRYIGEKIETELELAQVIPETQRRFCEIVTRLAEKEQVQAIVLGCTELPTILNQNLSPVPCLDVMKIHIDKLISMILKEQW